MKRAELTKQFERDLKKLKKKGYDIKKINDFIDILLSGKQIPKKYHDHDIKYYECYSGSRECHIERNWLLLYIMKDNGLNLIRTGSHEELFRNSYYKH